MAYTEGTIKIDNNRTQFACTDSGPAKGQTLFLFHGISFDKRVFLKLFPLAQASNLRLVAINRRDYEPTSLYTDQETNQITKANADKSDCVEFYLERGREWAAVVTQFHDQHNLEGDCGVLAWSLGNQTLMAFLAALPTLSQEVLGKLQKCLKTVIMLGELPYFWAETSSDTLPIPNEPNQIHPTMSSDSKNGLATALSSAALCRQRKRKRRSAFGFRDTTTTRMWLVWNWKSEY